MRLSAISAVLALPTAAALALCPDVTIADGTLHGTSLHLNCAYQKIPYARPPLGSLRWAPPVRNAPWAPAVYDATQKMPVCKQARDAGSVEDCLYLTVVAPHNATGLPVVVHFHRGAFMGGTVSYAGGAANTLTMDRVILVAVSYRLNVFGFLGADALRPRDAAAGSTGNYGLQDQRLALQWVRDNAAAFGGDASRVTLTGSSAGAASAALHLVMRRSWGLFAGAAMHSGALMAIDRQSMPEANALYAALLNETGCAAVGCLESLGTAPLFDAYEAIYQRFIVADAFDPTLPAGLLFQPTIDGVELEADSGTLARRGQIAPGVAIMAGGTREDVDGEAYCANNCSARLMPTCGAGAGVPGNCSEEDFLAWVNSSEMQHWFALPNGSAVQHLYSNERAVPPDSRWYTSAKHIFADWFTFCPSRRLARWSSDPAYLYWFTCPWSEGKQCLHTSQFEFFMGIPIPDTLAKPYAPQTWWLWRQMSAYFVNFAYTGDPNTGPHSVDTRWPRYANGTDEAIELGAPIVVHSGLKSAKCALWDSLI